MKSNPYTDFIIKKFGYTREHANISNNWIYHLVVSGTIAGGVTLNPIVLGTKSGAGVLLKTYSDRKKLLEKIEPYRFAYTSYGKKMVDLRSFMRSKSYDDQDYLTQLRVLDYRHRYVPFS